MVSPRMSSFARVTTSVVLASVFALVVACSSSDSSSSVTGDDAGPGTSFGSDHDSGATSEDDAGTDSAAPPASPGDCDIADLTGVPPVTPTFKVYDTPPGTVPDTMTGGTIAGTYTVDKATVYLPKNFADAEKPDTSTGTMTAWAVFEGTSYKFSMDYDFKIDTVLGPQAQKATVKDSGTYSVNGANLTRETSCDPGSAPQQADLSFTDSGARGTIVMKTTISTPLGPGDVYIQLDAKKTP
jgi:hypothetical protein